MNWAVAGVIDRHDGKTAGNGRETEFFDLVRIAKKFGGNGKRGALTIKNGGDIVRKYFSKCFGSGLRQGRRATIIEQTSDTADRS